MSAVTDLTRVLLLLTCLLPTGVSVKKQSVFVYSRLGGDTVLPCTGLQSNPNCSLVSWTFFKGGQVRYTTEVSGGKLSTGSDKSSRLSITSNCSLTLRDLRVDDAGSYVCLQSVNSVTDVYLSILTITSQSTIADLQPGGNLTLNCVLFTYYDAGSCRSYSSMFNLSWAAADGTMLQPEHSRYELIGHSRCSVTLVTNLRREDNNRAWRCQVTTKGNIRAAFQDFTSRFLFEDAPTALIPPAEVSCPVHLPISRITLCVALPIMVIIVGVCRKKGERRKVRTSAAGIELQEVNC